MCSCLGPMKQLMKSAAARFKLATVPVASFTAFLKMATGVVLLFAPPSVMFGDAVVVVSGTALLPAISGKL